MAITNTTVAKSSNTYDAALNLNAKAFELRRTVAGVWDLKPSSTTPPESAFSLNMVNESTESVVDADERKLVEEQHFNPGGKYRSIVKLFIHYEFQKPGAYAMGTGWLIAPDLLVTAGHCSYDWSYKFGRATEVKAYIGYRGKDRVNDPNVQFRTVSKIVTTEGWLKTKGQKSFDVSFMKVDKPFTGIQPFRYEETPATGNMVIGVVGYPGDLKNATTGENGAFMFEMFLQTQWELATQSDTMLEYQIDTFGGNSGSPVLRNNDLVAIGAHVYGGALNSASVIGKYGNPYVDYVAAFKMPVPKEGLNLIEVTPSKSAGLTECPNCHFSLIAGGAAGAGGQAKLSDNPLRTPARAAGQPHSHPAARTNLQAPARLPVRAPVSGSRRASATDEEGFFDILKTVAKFGLPIAGTVAGVVGGPIGAIAGVALNAAAKLAESAQAEAGGLEPDTSAPVQEGALERAILAEAVLCTIQAGNLHPELEESIFTDMKDSVMAALPTIKKVAPRIMGAMMEPALKIAMDSLHKYNTSQGGAEAFTELQEPMKPILYTAAIDHPGDQHAEGFLDFVLQALTGGQESAMGGEEGMWADIARAGLRVGQSAHTTGLPILSKALGNQESIEVDPNSAAASQAGLSAENLAKRAMVAECALQAVMKLPPHELQEEGFFGSLLDNIKTFGPKVLQVAPSIIGVLSPTVGKIVGGIMGQESLNEGPYQNAPSLGAPSAPRRGVLRAQQNAGDPQKRGSLFGRLQERDQGQVRAY